jgi:hypothetical protein
MIEPITSIFIPETREINDIRKKFTLYTVSIKGVFLALIAGPVKSFAVSKRYKEFYELNQQLNWIASAPPFPEKSWFSLSSHAVEQRRKDLER